jgi:hypothetical protein
MAENPSPSPDKELHHQDDRQQDRTKESAKQPLLSATTQRRKSRYSQHRYYSNLDMPGGVHNLDLKLRSLYQTIIQCEEQKNPMIYNRCCLTFTTKSLKLKSDHPKDQQVSCNKLFKERGIQSEEQFIHGMKKEIKSFPLSRQFVPSLNSLHKEDMNRADAYLKKLE